MDSLTRSLPEHVDAASLSDRSVRGFGLLLVGFAGLLALLAWLKPEGLLTAAAILGAAWGVSMLLNDHDRRAQCMGLLLPGLLGVFGLPAAVTLPAGLMPVAILGLGVAAGLLILAAPQVGRRVYTGWMLAAVPIGWTITHVVLGLVYYLVVTPVGLLMRLVGYDPMHRRLDPQAATYWQDHPGPQAPARYFRQH
jgi:hypothetical protein